MNEKFYEKLELNKVLSQCAGYAVLGSAKKLIEESLPSGELSEVRERLDRTQEAEKLLFTAGVSGVEYFDDVSDLLSRAEKGSTLSCGELMQLNALNRAARIAFTSVNGVADEDSQKPCAQPYKKGRARDEQRLYRRTGDKKVRLA